MKEEVRRKKRPKMIGLLLGDEVLGEEEDVGRLDLVKPIVNLAKFSLGLAS